MHYTSDASLLFSAARSRDGDAIGEFARRYAALIYSVSLRITNDERQSEALTLQLLKDIAAAPQKVRGEPAVWIHEQSTRRAIAATVAGEKAARSDLAEEPRWEEVAPALDLALLKLGSRSRTVVIQHYCQRHSQDELAEMLQVTQPVVTRRLRKGLESLRVKLVQAGAGCSLGHLMMLLARHAASHAPEPLVTRATTIAVEHVDAAPPARGGWLGILTVWSVIAGLILAVAASYSKTRNTAQAQPVDPPRQATP